ncbi:flagellar filament capping protein FliD [Oceanospirillum sp.]|uniref:flagellar filament capping protein FliD n=1 Tax=Oceanospirillum sp. TaxID=2021254 RepID=UPI003A95C23D
MNFLGIGSGLDLSTMLEGLVNVAAQPKVEQLGKREIQTEDSLSGLGILKSLMSDFQTAADDLKDASLFTTMTPTLTQPSSGDLIKIESDTNAVASSYDIEVVNLASGSKATSDWRSVMYQSDSFVDTSAALGKSGTLSFQIDSGTAVDITVGAGDSLSDIKDNIAALSGIGARITDGRLEYYAEGTGQALTVTSSDADMSSFTTAGSMSEKAASAKDANLSGTLSFAADGKTFDVSLTGDETLDDIVAAVNSADDNFGVIANIIDGRLVYQSSVTGTGNDLSVTGITELATTGDVSMTSPASDAEIKVDGVSITNDSNEFDSAVAGLTITALKQSPGTGTSDVETSSVTVGENTGDVKSKVQAFASAYNKLRETMNELKGTVDEDGNYTAGKLSNDPIVRNVESVLNSMITQQVGGADQGMDTLYSIGLEIESDGTLATDSDRLDDALDNLEGMQKLFAGAGAVSSDGIADLISEQVDSYVGITGIIKGQEDSFQEQLDDLEEQYEAHSRYIESYRETLQQQFTALDTSMARMNAIMSQIQPQLAALSGISSS